MYTLLLVNFTMVQYLSKCTLLLPLQAGTKKNDRRRKKEDTAYSSTYSIKASVLIQSHLFSAVRGRRRSMKPWKEKCIYAVYIREREKERDEFKSPEMGRKKLREWFSEELTKRRKLCKITKRHENKKMKVEEKEKYNQEGRRKLLGSERRKDKVKAN